MYNKGVIKKGQEKKRKELKKLNICIFDTETTSLDKPFCYNIGYVIIDTDTRSELIKRDFVVEQVWHNLPLFTSAYYADKRPLYVSAMRKREAVLDKYGYILRQMRSDFKKFKVHHTYAYNSSFDDNVFEYNCDWYKCNNPFDTKEIHDIRGYAIAFLVDDDYKKFCDDNGFYTESGNYSTTAEVMYRYITNNVLFVEEHTALSDAEIEKEILLACLDKGADITKDYPCPRSVAKPITKKFRVVKDNVVEYETDCSSILYQKTKQTIRLKS